MKIAGSYIFLLLAMAGVLSPVFVRAEELFVQGECGYFLISSEEEFWHIEDMPGESFRLSRDLNFAGLASPGPIDGFRGTLDGAGHTIRGLSHSLFGRIEGGEISNLVLENVILHISPDSGEKYFSAGILADEIVGGKIESVRVCGEITVAAPCGGMFPVGAKWAVGGLVGRVTGAKPVSEAITFGAGAEFINCRALVKINILAESPETITAGGFVGILSGQSRVSASHAKGDVIAPQGVAGGFAGEITGSSRIEFSTASGSVAGGKAAGGFVGIISEEGAPNTITASLALASAVSGPARYTRRFAGRTHHPGINNCYAFLGTVLLADGNKTRVTPSPFGPDGGDISRAQIKKLKSF